MKWNEISWFSTCMKTYRCPVFVAEVPNWGVEVINVWCAIQLQSQGSPEESSVCLVGPAETHTLSCFASWSICFHVLYLHCVLPGNLRWLVAAPPRWRNTETRSRSWNQIWISLLSHSRLSRHHQRRSALDWGRSFAVSLYTVTQKLMMPFWKYWNL